MALLPPGLRRLIREAHRRSLWQVLGIYLLASWGVLQVVDTLTGALQIPGWFPSFALALLLLGLPVVVATAFVQEGGPGAAGGEAPAGGGPDPSDPSRDEPPGPDGREDGGGAESPAPGAPGRGTEGTEHPTGVVPRLLTWRNAIGGGVVAFALWGVIAAGWVAVEGRALRQGLEAESPGEPALDPARVAVLYFEDFSPDSALGYLADGFTEALIHELSQVPALDVLSRNAVRPFRDGRAGADSVARLLAAGTLVEGSLEAEGDRLLVTVQLIDGASASHLLSRRIERTGEDLIRLRDDIVVEVARLLRRRLGEAFEVRRLQRGTTDRAWALLQQAERARKDAESLWERGDTTGMWGLIEHADSLLAGAEREDPAWVEPVVARASLFQGAAFLSADQFSRYDTAAARRGIRHADRALIMDPAGAEALEVRGRLRFYLWESGSTGAEEALLMKGSEEDLRAAVTADPDRATAWSGLAETLRSQGRFEEARLAAERAYEADAFLADAQGILFRLCHLSIEVKEFDDARRWCDEGRARFPDAGSFIEAKLLLMASDVGPSPEIDSVWATARALERALPPQRRERWRPNGLMYVAAGIARAGLPDSAVAVVRRARKLEQGDDPYLDYYEAYVRLRLGQPDSAMALLEHYVRQRPQERSYLANDWWWEELFLEPRFIRLVQEPS